MSQFLQDLQDRLAPYNSQRRNEHVLRVAQTAGDLAKHWNLSEDSAHIAGLAHDIAKSQTPESLLEIGLASHLVKPELYETFPSIWHAFVGPSLIRHEFDFVNEDAFEAILWHTTGKSDMTDMSKILYIADYIEPGRTHPYKNLIDSLAKRSLDEGTFATAWCSIRALLSKGYEIHPYTFACYNHYHKLCSPQQAKSIADQLHEISNT